MTRQSNEERLVVLETKIDAITEQLKNIDHKLELMQKSFVSFPKHQDDMRDVKDAIERNSKQIERMQRLRWIQNTMAAAFGALLSLLIAYFINNIGA